MKRTLIGLGLSLFAISCSQNTDTGKRDIVFENLDTTVSPAQDFFQYAHGGWIKRTPIPDDQSSWGIGHMVREDIYNKLKALNETAAGKVNEHYIYKKAADFWASAMDTVQIEKDGITHLKPMLGKIDAVSDIQSLMNVGAEMDAVGSSLMFSLGIHQDLKNSEKVMIYFEQGGIGLPNRDYYFRTDDRTKNVRDKYRIYLKNVFSLMGMDSGTAKTKANTVYTIEEYLAGASKKLEEMRDPHANYNKMTLAQFSQIMPGIDWKKWLEVFGARNIDTIIVGQPAFFAALHKGLTKFSLDQWKDYLKLRFVRSFAGYLSADFDNNQFEFYGKTLSGIQQKKVRWKRVIDLQDNLFGEGIGQLFAKEYFNEKAKARYENMVEEIRAAMKERIEKLDWMSDSTKQKALVKLAAMKKKVGYPDKWKDFTNMDISKKSYVENVMSANKWWIQYHVSKLYKPVDKDEWTMNPQTYNAGYMSSLNTITLPAGIFMVPGFRDEELDDAVVYGYAGASTIGHEICHGFDDEGRKFDGDGNLKNWWTKEDEERFTKKADLMVRQFGEYVAVDTMHVNGHATLGENIADFAGVILGWEAFKKTAQYKENKKINGLTPAQRYFLGYALGWLAHYRKEYLQQMVLSDVHSPAKFRVNGPFSNLPAFYEAFDVKPGDSMYRPDSLRVKIW